MTHLRRLPGQPLPPELLHLVQALTVVLGNAVKARLPQAKRQVALHLPRLQQERCERTRPAGHKRCTAVPSKSAQRRSRWEDAAHRASLPAPLLAPHLRVLLALHHVGARAHRLLLKVVPRRLHPHTHSGR